MIKHRYLFILFLVMSIWSITTAQDSTRRGAAGIDFVLINPGKFWYGKFAPPFPVPDSAGAAADNGYTAADYALAKQLALRDAHAGFEVVIDKPFYIGKYEVTQEQWKAVMKDNPTVFNGDSLPMANVTWQQAQRFVERLNQLDTTMHYRLPTEFEWEYAARAGAADDISWDDIRKQAQLGGNSPQPIARKTPNAWGLYDMLGNVWEWTDDLYNEKLFADSFPPANGDQHVLKGASFTGDVKNATYMTHAAGPGNGWDIGLRIVMEPRAAIKTHRALQSKKSTRTRLIPGWHLSRTTHQGTTPAVSLNNGIITVEQHPYGQGGVLLTDRKYRDFELSLEVKLDSFCNSGILLRSTESGQAYQVELSEPGGTGNLFGEMLRISKTAEAVDRKKVWNANGWNEFRIRMSGDTPRITLWINGHQMWDVIQPVNDFTAGATSGMIGLQIHWSATYSPESKAFDMSGSWKPAGKHQFKNIRIRELKRKRSAN